MDKLGLLIIHLPGGSHFEIYILIIKCFALLLRVCENNEWMLFLQAEELKEKEKENHKLVNDLEEKQTKCSKLVIACGSFFFFAISMYSNLPFETLANY